MPTAPAELVEELQDRLVDLQVNPAKLLPALEDAWAFAEDEADADWSITEIPSIARRIVVRGARQIIVNPDRARMEQGGDQITQMSVTDIFSRDELRRLRSLRATSRVGSIRLTSPGLARAGQYDQFLPPEGERHVADTAGWYRP